MHLRLIRLAALLALVFPVHDATARSPRKTQDTAPPTAKEAPAQDTSLNNLKDAPSAPVLACAGPFAKDTNHARLVTEFGARNVEFKDVEGTDSVKQKASVIFDADPTKRMVFYWDDIKSRTKLTRIVIDAPSTWLGPGGIRNGLPLKELEKINGGAFSIKGFGGVGGGDVSGLKGPLADISGDCKLAIRFEPGIANPLPPRYAAITGDVVVPSTNVTMRRVRAQVSEWSLNYR